VVFLENNGWTKDRFSLLLLEPAQIYCDKILNIGVTEISQWHPLLSIIMAKHVSMAIDMHTSVMELLKAVLFWWFATKQYIENLRVSSQGGVRVKKTVKAPRTVRQ
jgi:hypothetical protein